MAATDKNMTFDVNLLPTTTGDHNLGSSDKKWNLYVNQINGVSPVTGVKGNAETNYRTGQVNLTAANIGAIAKNEIGNTQQLVRPEALNGVNDITIQSLINDVRANRLAFLPPDQVIIEQTIDGGNTWTDAEVTDAQKANLFSEKRQSPILIPLINEEININCGLRITITAMKYNVPANTPEIQKYNYWNSNYVQATERYCQLKNMYFWVSSGRNSIKVKIERASGAASTNWITVFDKNDYGMTGWSGNDFITFKQERFGGIISQTTQFWNYRITLMTRGPGGGTELDSLSLTSQQYVMEIRGYGDGWWTKANEYMASDHLYSWDYNQNAIFPAAIRPLNDNSQNLGISNRKWANVYATTFIGNLTGNVTGNLTGNVTGNVSGSAGSVSLSGVTGADDLKAIEALSETSGLLKKTAANTWSLVTLADLGLSNAMHFLGITTTNISTGTANTTATVSIEGSNVTAAAGDVVLYGSQEYVWGNNKWNLLGDESSYKIKQTAKADPTASTTTSTTFIDTISQDANGVITATKKTLPTASTTVAGITKVGASGGAAAYSHTHYELATTGDNRNDATIPNDYTNRLIFQGLKAKSAIDEPSTDTYSYLIGLRGWADSSGGDAWELAFNNKGIAARHGSTDTWNVWKKVVLANKAGVGSSSQPVYVDANGDITLGSTYAGGTAVTLNNSSKASSTASFYAPTAGGTANTQALVGDGATSAPKWVNISPSISITAGTSSAAPSINVTVLGQSGAQAQAITTASTSVYGVTKLQDGVSSTSTALAATANAAYTASRSSLHTLAATTKYYITGTTSATTSTGGDSFDTGVYVTATAGELSAVRYSFNISGTEKVHAEWNNTDQCIDFIFN